MVPEIQSEKDKIFGHFCLFTPPPLSYTNNLLKSKLKKKTKKTSGDLIILHMCSKNHDMKYAS